MNRLIPILVIGSFAVVALGSESTEVNVNKSGDPGVLSAGFPPGNLPVNPNLPVPSNPLKESPPLLGGFKASNSHIKTRIIKKIPRAQQPYPVQTNGNVYKYQVPLDDEEIFDDQVEGRYIKGVESHEYSKQKSNRQRQPKKKYFQRPQQQDNNGKESTNDDSSSSSREKPVYIKSKAKPLSKDFSSIQDLQFEKSKKKYDGPVGNQTIQVAGTGYHHDVTLAHPEGHYHNGQVGHGDNYVGQVGLGHVGHDDKFAGHVGQDDKYTGHVGHDGKYEGHISLDKYVGHVGHDDKYVGHVGLGHVGHDDKFAGHVGLEHVGHDDKFAGHVGQDDKYAGHVGHEGKYEGHISLDKYVGHVGHDDKHVGHDDKFVGHIGEDEKHTGHVGFGHIGQDDKYTGHVGHDDKYIGHIGLDKYVGHVGHDNNNLGHDGDGHAGLVEIEPHQEIVGHDNGIGYGNPGGHHLSPEHKSHVKPLKPSVVHRDPHDTFDHHDKIRTQDKDKEHEHEHEHKGHGDGYKDQDGYGYGKKDFEPYLYDMYKVPECAYKNKHYYNLTFCLEDHAYPLESILWAIHQAGPHAHELLSDVTYQSADNLVTGLTRAEEEGYTYKHYFGGSHSQHTHLEQYKPPYQGYTYSKDYFKKGGYICPSDIYYGRPKRAMNTYGKWKVIVNVDHIPKKYQYGHDNTIHKREIGYDHIGHKGHGIVPKPYTQTIRLEQCIYANAPCSYIDSHYHSRCIQKHNFVRLVSWTHEEGLHVDTFKMPIACSCHIRQPIHFYRESGHHVEGHVSPVHTYEHHGHHASTHTGKK